MRLTQSELLIRMGYGTGTNPVCSDERPFMTLTGCLKCGHTKGEHSWPR